MEFQEYCPNPVDTSGVELPIELHSLVEQMARCLGSVENERGLALWR